MIHISSLQIETYRGIQNLQLNDFSLVNIFTGDNNTGKTSVLEILRTLSSPLSLSTWLANGRKGNIFREVSDFEAFSDLFNVNSQSKIISYNVIDSNKENYSVIMSAELSSILLSQNQIYKERGFPRSRKEEDNIVEIDADIIFKATMVDGVYNCDPKKNADAVKYDHLSFSEVLNKDLAVMDSTAASMCKDNHIPILVFSIEDPQNIVKAMKGELIGTIVEEA